MLKKSENDLKAQSKISVKGVRGAELTGKQLSDR